MADSMTPGPCVTVLALSLAAGVVLTLEGR
jgi:hypothetical protein